MVAVPSAELSVTPEMNNNKMMLFLLLVDHLRPQILMLHVRRTVITKNAVAIALSHRYRHDRLRGVIAATVAIILVYNVTDNGMKTCLLPSVPIQTNRRSCPYLNVRWDVAYCRNTLLHLLMSSPIFFPRI